MSELHYVGSELDVFAHAKCWKSYVRNEMGVYLVGDVLEVGAGIGAATQSFNSGTQRRWVCLEPDPALAERIKPGLPHGIHNCEVAVGTLNDLPSEALFDAVLYMDVLEHIEDDAAELALASKHLEANGALVVLSPAFPWLYTPFDAAIGHYRRYTKKSLRAIAPACLREEKCVYLDAIGMLASAGNRLFLQAAAPSLAQIRFWDGFMVPISRFVDGG